MKTETTTRNGVRLHVFTCDRTRCGRESATYPGEYPRRWAKLGGQDVCQMHAQTRALRAPRGASARKAAAA
jgi:hypothetical protein